MTLPNFLVIGAYKAGTTSLHHYLDHHPDVFVPAVKEPRFLAFDGLDDPEAERRSNPMYRGAIPDLGSYEALFDSVGAERAVGEVSPEYLKNPNAPDRILARLPEVRLIAILRDPTDRAYSDYLMYRRDGLEGEVDFMKALHDQDRRRADGDPTGQYLVTGRYGEQLERYYDRFDHDRIKVVLHDDLRHERDSTLADLFRFLGVDPGVSVAPLPTLNRSGVFTSRWMQSLFGVRRRLAPLARTIVPAAAKRRIDGAFQARLHRPTIPLDAKRWLDEYYAEDVARAGQLTGIDLASRWGAERTERTAS